MSLPCIRSRTWRNATLGLATILPAPSLQRLGIFEQFWEFLDTALQALQELLMQRSSSWGQTVVAPITLFASKNQARFAKISQMSRGFRLWHS